MPKLKNFLPLARSYFDHELWNEEREFSKAEAWLWMLKEARYSETEGKKWINGRLVTWEKGEILGAIRYLKKAWNWNSNGKVYRFLEYLKSEQMIEVATEQGVNVISLCNHSTYNEHLYSNGTPNRTQLNTDKNGHSSGSNNRYSEQDESNIQPSTSNTQNSEGPSDLELTKQLVEYWNDQNGTRLRVAKSRKKVSQVRQRRKSFTIKEMRTAVYNRSNNQWVQENNQQSNWDALFRNDNNMEDWLHRDPDNEAGNEENIHPLKRGCVTEEEAKAHAKENRVPFKESIYPPVEYEGETYYEIPQN